MKPIMRRTTIITLAGVAFCVTCANAREPDVTWTANTQQEWLEIIETQSSLEIENGQVAPVEKEGTFTSVLKRFEQKRSAQSLTIEQSSVWANWKPVSNIGPSNLADAPVMLSLGPDNYWMFGLYKGRNENTFEAKNATLDGFDVPLKTTPFKHQYDAPGGLQKTQGGYHAWQSKDMVNWVHHGPVSDYQARWMTTAEIVDGKAYLYYDFPNDQNPHLIIDEDLTDGLIGKKMGMVFKDPSNGSDCAVIRDLDGNFHVIAEDWSPIDASTHAWDSPLATHAVSPDGISDFKILDPAVDERTEPTGKFAEHIHPHWHKEDPENYPGKVYEGKKNKHKVRRGQTVAFARYEVHEPEQNAFGDWASICIGGQYYLFCDFDPSTAHGNKKSMSVAWFTSDDINKQFTFCGNLGSGHPDPDVMFAEGQFYLATQMSKDYVSPGPWVERIELRVGVDVSNDGKVDQWTEWQEVKETYDYISGFSKQVSKTAAKIDLSSLPQGYGFQFEVKMTDTTDNPSKPILDKMALSFKN